jgi:hypothetical protein
MMLGSSEQLVKCPIGAGEPRERGFVVALH